MNSKRATYHTLLSDIKERKRGLHSQIQIYIYITNKKRKKRKRFYENSCGTNRNEEMALLQITLLPVFSTERTVKLEMIIVTPTNSYH